jgi:hypothetical protein
LKWTFAFGFIAIDSTGRMPLLCHGSDAETFLSDIEAVNLNENLNYREKIKSRLVYILSDVAEVNGPTLDVCIRSNGKRGSPNVLRYSIFDTAINIKLIN